MYFNEYEKSHCVKAISMLNIRDIGMKVFPMENCILYNIHLQFFRSYRVFVPFFAFKLRCDFVSCR